MERPEKIGETVLRVQDHHLRKPDGLKDLQEDFFGHAKAQPAVNRFVFDFADLSPETFTDSSVVGFLAVARRKITTLLGKDDMEIVVRNPAVVLRDKLQITRLDQMLTVEGGPTDDRQ